MVEYLRKSESCDDKIARVNSIRITESTNLVQFFMVLMSLMMLTFLN